MDLAVIIVTHNQHDLLRQCLRSVLAAMNGVEGEVVVVDNASTDATQQVMAGEFPQVRVIHNQTNLHYTRAVNQGMRATDAQYVFLLNDDTEVEPDCLRALIAFMDAHPRCGAVGPMLVSPDFDVQRSAQKFPTPFREIMCGVGIAWWLRNRQWAAGMQSQYPAPMETQIVDWACGGALLLRRSVMERLGYHDVSYLFYRDDPDIGMRMRLAGWEVWYNSNARVIHHHGMSTVKTNSKTRFELVSVRSRRHYHRKFHGLPAVILVECCYGVSALLRAFKSLALLRLQAAAEQWQKFVLLFEALAVPPEEREAIAGYHDASYNGMDAGPNSDTCRADRINPVSRCTEEGVQP
ncbi:MAG: glycosyltransferase family 2 protein [Phycisphaerales bacterium]|nr:MAG: glycosyltransferase family 2 protein [Phycisphaerales bacterium]